MRLQLPAKLDFLLTKRSRFKVMHGGRGGGKSHSVARALVFIARRKKTRILCTREVQKSLKDSVYQLLWDTIEGHGVAHEFTKLETEIRHEKTGSRFLFAGISQQTADSLKSLEGVDIAWVEEAHSVSESSWRILIPTIRKPESEIWITLNPRLGNDPTYQRFIARPPSNAIVVSINYWDNPWFPDVLDEDRKTDEERLDAQVYRNIWCGEPIEILEGSIFAREMRQLAKLGRIGKVPVNPTRPLNTFWDLGTSTGNATCIWVHQRVGMADRFSKAIGGTGEGMEHWWRELEEFRQDVGGYWGVHHLPHDGKANMQGRRLINRKSILQGLIAETPGRKSEVVVVPRVDDLPAALESMRLRMMDAWFDSDGCAQGIHALRTYRYEWIEAEQRYSRHPHHGPESNWADAFRQWATGFKPEGPRPDSGSRTVQPTTWISGTY